MAKHVHKRLWIRWLARLYGSLLAGAWLVVRLFSAFINPAPLTFEGVFMAGFMITGVTLTGVAWRDELVGGMGLVLMSGVFSIFAYVSAGHNIEFAMLICGGPFLVSGLLFLMSGRWAGQRYGGRREVFR